MTARPCSVVDQMAISTVAPETVSRICSRRTGNLQRKSEFLKSLTNGKRTTTAALALLLSADVVDELFRGTDTQEVDGAAALEESDKEEDDSGEDGDHHDDVDDPGIELSDGYLEEVAEPLILRLLAGLRRKDKRNVVTFMAFSISASSRSA